MKKIFAFLTFALITQVAFAQQNVELKINHLLDNAPFSLNSTATTPDGSDIQYSRFEYYLSEISLVHDGGMVTVVPDTWLLVQAQNNTVFSLGSFNVQTIEGIRFHIGVEQASNHLDPASFPPTHPLAPQNPSMHWGWASGYRFLALEGVSGAGFSQVFEIHALGDQNYKQTNIDCGAVSDANGLIIELNADYTQALKGIYVESGLINHGFDGEAVTSLLNMKDDVFSPVALNTSTKDAFSDLSISISPNPSSNGTSYLEFDNSNQAVDRISIFDLSGKMIYSTAVENTIIREKIDAISAGTYLVQFSKDQVVLGAKKWLIN